MIVFHGSFQVIQYPNIDFGRFKLDFGKGFYVTTFAEQAEKWALRQALIKRAKPIVNTYEFDAERLDILYFEGYNEQWLDFVVKNRAGIIEEHKYDAICGNIANDDVAAVVNDYMRLQKMGRMSPSGKQFFLEQLQYSKPNNQFCISTNKGIDALKFTRSYSLEG